MVKELLEKANGSKKPFLAALLGGIITAIPTAVVVGEYKGKIDSIDTAVTRHVMEYTPNIAADYQATKTRVAVQQEQIASLQKSLDEIKKQNETIIALMRRK